MESRFSTSFSKSLAVDTGRVVEQFEFPADNVRRAVKHFVQQMEQGLINDGDTMIPSYVTALPDGTEKGVCIAVDIGGTNCRVCSVELHGNRQFSIKQSKTFIPRHLMAGCIAKDLFSFIAAEVEIFLETHYQTEYATYKGCRATEISHATGHFRGRHLPLGFTFSFTFQQTAIDRGIMSRWDKGFDIPDAIGKDVCSLLQEEINIRDLPIQVTALANDTVGTLMARAYTSDSGRGLLGAVFGTGTNGAYIEKLDRVTRLQGSENVDSTAEMVINTEWGSFDESLTILPNTPYDNLLDRTSVHPGEQMFEKRVSGMYLGELFRLAILGILEEAQLNLSHSPGKPPIAAGSPLYRPYAVDTSILSEIEGDEDAILTKTRCLLERQLGVSHVSLDEARAVKEITHAIGKRAARLSGVAIAAVIVKSGRLSQPSNSAAAEKPEYIDIGVEGSLVEHYPGFEENIRLALREVAEIGPEGESMVRIGLAKDGSGVGAALVAMMADKQKNWSTQGDNAGTEERSKTKVAHKEVKLPIVEVACGTTTESLATVA